jgi:class 3 adenylate cyclase
MKQGAPVPHRRRTSEQGIGGIAVHIGSRVAGLGDAGDVLVTRTMKDPTTGSGIEFEPRGTHALRGVPGEWELYAPSHSSR